MHKNLHVTQSPSFRNILAFFLMFSFCNLGIGQAPSSVLPDLQYFKLTFPLDANGNDYEGVSYGNRNNPLIKAWERDDLQNWSPSSPYSQYFFVSNGEVVFRAHCAGALTSANSYPRCELRETPNGTDDLWLFADEQELNATFRVTNLPNEKKEVCMLQIKGNDSNNTSGTEEAFRLEYREDGSQGVHVTINETNTINDIMDYSVGQTIESRMYINNGTVTIELNNTSVSGSSGEWNYTYSSNYSHGYFKAGAYTQSSIWEEKNGVADESPNAYGEVRFSELILGPDDGGGTSCTPSVPSNRGVGSTGTSSATVTWNSVSGIDHYKVRHRATGTSSWTTSPSISSSATSYNISGLSNNTSYEWQIRSKCEDNTGSNYSAGQGPNFTTSSGGGGLPSPWLTTDIGNVGATGSASYSGSTFTVGGSGADIWNSADEFRFVYQTLSGDGEIVAKVNSLTNTNSWAKAGVMIRESLSAGSKHAMTIVRPSAGVSFQRRTSTNGSSAHSSSGGHAPAEWLKIVRSGNSFTSFHSNNGSSWTQLGGAVTISMSSSVYVGLCVTSHADGNIATASINSVSINSGPPSGNLALNKSTQQSSTDYGGLSARAVDGNTNGNWGNGSVTHTDPGNAPHWWEVDLGATYPIGQINVFNRTDNCCTWRLGNFTVSVQNASGSTVWSQTVTSVPNPSQSLNAGGVSGRTIRVDQNLSAPLSLAEVQVYASTSNFVTTGGLNPQEVTLEHVIDQEKQTEQCFKVYPNPATDMITVEGLKEDHKLRIYNVNGSLILETSNKQINIDQLTNGVYFIQALGYETTMFIKN